MREHLDGLFASGGYSSPQKPQAFPLMGGKWLAIIEGVENGVCVRSWTGPEFRTKAEALRAATEAFALSQPKESSRG